MSRRALWESKENAQKKKKKGHRRNETSKEIKRVGASGQGMAWNLEIGIVGTFELNGV